MCTTASVPASNAQHRHVHPKHQTFTIGDCNKLQHSLLHAPVANELTTTSKPLAPKQHLEKNTTGDRAYLVAIANEGAHERRGVASNTEDAPEPSAASGT
jgi:hypothetical protein